MSACKSCQAPVVWAKTVNGKSMPLDPTPVAGGNVRLVRGGAPGGGLLAEVLTDEQRAAHRGGALHVSHFATCAHAAEHRRG